MTKTPIARQSNCKTYLFLIAALGGLLFGLDRGSIANSLISIKDVYHLDISGGEKYSAILATGGVIGALLSGIFARFLGRKKSLVFTGLIFTVASIVSAMLPSIAILSACRFTLGFGVGISSFVVPLYLSETSPASIRGSMGVMFSLMITIGIFLISLTNALTTHFFATPTIILTLMFSVIAVFAALMLLSSLFLPESPRWLMLKGKKERAVGMLKKLFNTKEEVDFEIKEIELVLRKSKEDSVKSVGHSYFIKILLIGVVLQMFQQLVGINVMIYYAPTIFGYAGITGFVAMMTIPFVNMVFTFPAIRWIEKFGRKKLLYVGAATMLVTMITAGLIFQHIGQATSVGMVPKVLLLLAAIIYIFGFATSWGPVTWIVCSEIFPLKDREIGITVTTMINWIFAGLVMRYSLSFMEKFGKPSLFYLLSVFCILAIMFVAKFVPETKGITLEELEIKLKKGK